MEFFWLGDSQRTSAPSCICLSLAHSRRSRTPRCSLTTQSYRRLSGRVCQRPDSAPRAKAGSMLLTGACPAEASWTSGCRRRTSSNLGRFPRSLRRRSDAHHAAAQRPCACTRIDVALYIHTLCCASVHLDIYKDTVNAAERDFIASRVRVQKPSELESPPYPCSHQLPTER